MSTRQKGQLSRVHQGRKRRDGKTGNRECLVMKINPKCFAAAIIGTIDPLSTDPLAFDCSAPAVIPLCHYCICMTDDTYLFFLTVHCHFLSSPIWGRIPPPSISIWSCLFPVTSEFLFASVGSQALGFWKVP